MAAVADAISVNRHANTYRYDSDDFVTPEECQRQLDELQAYIDARREHEQAKGLKKPLYALPRPLGWKLTVLVLTVPKQSEGGVIFTDDNQEAKTLSSPQGVVLALGASAYSDPGRFTVEGQVRPWVKVGDRISFVKYDASMFQLANGQRLGQLSDTQPALVIDEGWKVPA